VVGEVFRNRGEPYVLAYFKEGKHLDTDVTFNLKYWQGDGEPEQGQMVELTKVQLFAGGWRASVARPIILKE
jgi:hypothetical protein